MNYEFFPIVGTGGPGLFPADFIHDGKAVLFSGAIRVRRIGTLKDVKHFVFECWGKCWNGEYLTDKSARWYDERVQPIEAQPELPIVTLATDDDYYRFVLPAIKQLERSIAAECDPLEVEPYKVGLVDCLRFIDIG